MESGIVRTVTDKRGLAERYMVGVRTIEEWHGTGIIHGTRQGKQIFFDVENCDCRLRQFQNPKDNYAHN